MWAGRAAGIALFISVLFMRGGPIAAQNDALAVTGPTTAVSHGQWKAAVVGAKGYDPPGYPLLAAPMVAMLRPWVGSPAWCSDRALPVGVRGGPQADFYRAILRPCSAQRSGDPHVLPRWYRSQAVLGIGAWLVLLLGAELLLRAAHRGPTLAEAAAPIGLALVPAGSDSIIGSFHPQDVLCVGLCLLALSQLGHRRWLLSGAILGVAVLCKQFAVLAFLPALACAPTVRARVVLAAGAMGAAAAGMAPFLVAAPAATWHSVTGTYVQGAGVLRSATAFGLLGLVERQKLELAHAVPVVVSAALCVAAWLWLGDRLFSPVAALGLTLACMATRLVFEVSILGYYLLAVGALLFLLDMAVGRLPLRSAAWIVATRFGVLSLPSSPPAWVAVTFMTISLAAVALGLADLRRHVPRRRASPWARLWG